MESSHNQLLEYWTQFLAGEELSAQQRQMLLDALRSDRTFRAFAQRDQELNWLLAELQTDELPKDDFVQGVMVRCQQEDILPQREGLATNGQSQSKPRAGVARSARFVVESPPVRRESKATESANNCELPEKVNGHEEPSPKPPARKRRQQISPQLIALACAFLFVLGIGALALIDLDGEAATNANNDQPDSAGSRQESIGRDDDRQNRSVLEPVLAEFATLTDAEDAIWSQSTKIGDRLGNEELHLLSGRAELTLDDGAVVNLSAPASFHLVSPAEVNLAEGNLSAVVPGHAIGFRVITPTSNIVDLGTEFDVAVEDSGATDVLVRRGEVAVTANDDAGQPEEMRLVADGLNQATVFERVAERPESPVASAARGTGGQFHGTISVNGKSMQFDDPEAFENVRQRVFTGFRATPNDVMKEWADFVESFHQQAGMQGSVTLNGVQVGFGSMEEAMRLHQKMQEAMRKMGGSSTTASSSSSSSAFQGTLTINGEVMTFTSREEYEAAQRKLFGSAATFGAGRVDKNE